MTACNCTSEDSSSSSSNSSIARSLSGDCDIVTGRCHCQQNVIADTCDTCAEGSFNFSVSDGCQLCNCHPVGSRSQDCNEVSRKSVNCDVLALLHLTHDQSVASLGGGVRGGGPPRVTPSRGVTPERKKIFVGKFTKNSGETRSDR